MDETILKDSVTNDEAEVVIDSDTNGKTMEDEYKEELDFLDKQIASNEKEKRRLMITCGVIFVLCVICLTARILAWG